MNDKISVTVNKYSLISKGDTVLIAFSGGADSVCLANYLLSVRDSLSLTLKAAHVEHGIRGAESLSDCSFAERFCKENDIECHILHIQAEKEAAAAKQSVEEYSRNKRYEFFYSIECDKIATAHNLSDNIETILFRIARGTSLKGMCGIPVKRDKIIRPLLEISAGEIRAYLDENKIHYCIDKTNNDNKYSRNFIRNSLIPMFEHLNPDFENTAQRLILSVNEDNSFLDYSADIAYNEAYNAKVLSVAKLKSYSKSIKKRVIVKYLSEFNITTDDFHLEEIVKLIDKPSKTQLSGNIYAVSDKNILRIAFFDNLKNDDFSKVSVDKKIVSYADFLNKCELYGKKFDFFCDYDKIVGDIFLRNRREGDTISPLGRGCTKSLKKLFNELHIPVENRNNIPIVSDDKGIIGLYGYCVDERVKTDLSTKKVLIVNIRAEDKI